MRKLKKLGGNYVRFNKRCFQLSALVNKFLGSDEKLIIKHFFDSEGRLKMYDANVQQAILDLIKPTLLVVAKEIEAEQKKAKK